MIHILHISDLHFLNNAASYNTEEVLLREAARKVKDVPPGKKLLIVTGDLHNFRDQDYKKAEYFLQKLVHVMGLDMTKDVFVIPGNHDVGNDAVLKSILASKDRNWKLHLNSSLSMLKSGNKDYIEERLLAFSPYCSFVQQIGIYDAASGNEYPASSHVRCWRGKLNILHLNTALIADGIYKADQMTDADMAASPETWKDYFDSTIPSLAIGHNDFFDLEKVQRTDLAGVFNLRNVSAYLCGDKHGTEKDPEHQMIRLKSGHRQGIEIPNLVATRSIDDVNDDYSEVGFCWHDWDEETDNVTVEFRRWTRENLAETVPDGLRGEYVMRHMVGDSSKYDILKRYLSDELEQRRDRHPSFKLLSENEIDGRLFPGIKENKLISPVGTTSEDPTAEKGKYPVWEIVRNSWSSTDHRSIVITGDSGIGKTVALLSITLETSNSINVPAVYISMYELVDANGNLLELDEYIGKRFQRYSGEIDALATESWNGQPSLLLLLDAFNEVPFSLRKKALAAVNYWHDTHPGVQIIAVSRPMEGIDLSSELSGNPVSVTLEKLEPHIIRDYLNDAGQIIPSAKSPLWEELRYPLFLNLYVKQGRLKGRYSSGYPLDIKDADNKGALIWNFLQRELLRHAKDKNDKSENWILCCAVANEFILPYLAYQMVSEHRMEIDYEQAVRWADDALDQFDGSCLPNHLKKVWETYNRQHGAFTDKDLFSRKKWRDTALQESGILLPFIETNETKESTSSNSRLVFIHQHFRDCLAAIFLVNMAEMTVGEFPATWKQDQDQMVLNYTADLIDEETVDKLWEINRLTLQYNNPEYDKDHSGTFVLLELQKRRKPIPEKLNFSGMDLQDISLTTYLASGDNHLPLFQKSFLTSGTKLNRSTFFPLAHTSTITCISVVSDGRIATGSEDGSLRIWDINSGRCLHVLEGHSRNINCLVVLPDGRIVSGSDDSSLRIWDINSGKCLHVLNGHFGRISCLAVLPDGRIVSSSDDNSLRVWDPASGRCLQVLNGHFGRISCLVALPDNRIVSGSDDNSLRVWDPASGMCLQVMDGHSSRINCLAVLPDGRIVSGSDDNFLRVWDPASGRCLQVLNGHFGRISCLAVLSNGYIVSGSDDNCLRVWDSYTGRCLHILKGHSKIVTCLALLHHDRIVSGSADSSIRIWDLFTGQCLQIYNDHYSPVNCLGVLFDGRIISSSADALHICLSDTGKCLNVLRVSEVNISRMDLSKAILTKDLARMLWQNGATIPDDDFQFISNFDDNARNMTPDDIDKQLSTLISDYFKEEGKKAPVYSHFLEYLNRNCPVELKPSIPTHMSYLFSFNEETSELVSSHNSDIQDFIYRLFLLDRGYLDILPSEDIILQKPASTSNNTISESEDQKISEISSNDTPVYKSEPEPEELETATYYILKEFEKWLIDRNISAGVEYEISKHPRQQPSGNQYGYDVGMNISIAGGQYHLGFECKCYRSLKRKSNLEKVKSIKIDDYSHNLVQYFMHCSQSSNNRWILVCPFGDLQANFQENLFNNWNRNHDYMKVFAITEAQSTITCRDFLSIDERAYSLIYHDKDGTEFIHKDKEEVFESLFKLIIGDDLVNETINNTLCEYFKTDNSFLNCESILEVQTDDGFNAFDKVLRQLQAIKLKHDKSVPDRHGVYVIGEYGTGKTWLAYRIIEQIVRHREQYPYDPVLIRMKELVGPKERITLAKAIDTKSVARQIVNEYFQNNHSDLRLRYQRCKSLLFILDGLDEVYSGFSYTSGKVEILYWAFDILRGKYPSSLFIVTSRESDYIACQKNNLFKYLSTKFDVVKLQQFKADDVVDSINKQAKGRERDKESLHKLAKNEKFVSIMQTPVFFNFLPSLVERPELLRIGDDNGEIDKFAVLYQIVDRALKKLDQNPEITERIYNCAIKCTKDNLQEVSETINYDVAEELSDLTISRIIPTDIMIVRSIAGNNCALGFKHNIIREFLVAKRLHHLLVNYCDSPEPNPAKNDFCLTVKEIPMTVETQQLFMNCIQVEKDEDRRNSYISALQAMACDPSNKKDVVLSTKILELLLQPDCGICGNSIIPFDLSGIHIRNLYVWKSFLKHVNLRNAHIDGLQLIDAELHDLDLEGTALYNLHMCTDDLILSVACRSTGNGCVIAVVFTSGQILQYSLHHLDVPTEYTAKIFTGINEVKNANAFFINSSLLIHTKRNLFTGNQKNITPVYQLDGKNDLERVDKIETGYALLFSNSGMFSLFISTDEKTESHMLGSVNPKLFCAVSETEFCYVQNNMLYYHKENDLIDIASWGMDDCCFTAKKINEILTIVILRIGSLIEIKYSEKDGSANPVEFKIDKGMPFQMVQMITENSLLAANENAVYILRIEKEKCIVTELEFNVRCTDLKLGDKPGETRLQDDAAYQILKSSVK